MNSLSAPIPAHLMREQEIIQPKNKMEKDDFLKLLMAQLNQQDPLNPLKHEEFASQLAQFTTLEKLTAIDGGIEKLHKGLGSEDRLQAMSMIGREIKATGRSVQLLQGNDVNLSFSAEDGARPVKARVYSMQGQLVREIDLLDGKVNGSDIRWDGKDQDGKQLPSGEYSFRIHAVGADGKATELGSELSGTVVGVEIEGKDPILLVKTSTGKSRVRLDKVSSVSVGGEKTTSSPTNIPVPEIDNRAKVNPQPKEAGIDLDSSRGFPLSSIVGRY